MPAEFIEGFRLSPLQKHIWLAQQAGHNQTYRAQCTLYIEGPLDRAILTVALEQTLARHEILRTAFRHLPGMALPLQVITNAGPLTWLYHDLSHLDPSSQAVRLDTLFTDMGHKPFNLEQGPAWHLALVRLAPTQHYLLLSLPALCADAATLDLLAREISRAYAAWIRGENLADEPVQYADLSEWQNELLEAEDTADGRAYWQQQDLSALRALKLPFERQSTSAAFDPQYVAGQLKPALAVQLKAVARQYEVSTAIWLQSCWHILLWRLAGQSNLITGLAADGRAYEELTGALGLFARYLPVQSYLENDIPFWQLLTQVNQATQEIYQWQEYFSWEQLGAANNGPGMSFWPFSFDFVPPPTSYPAAEVTFTLDRQYVCLDRFKIKLAGLQNDETLSFEFHYDASLFQAADIQRLAGQFQELVSSAVATPEAAIGALNMVTPAERRQLLVEFNQTQADYSLDRCIHHLFEAQAEARPNQVAIVFEEHHLTYAELNRRANQLAHHLQALGVGPDTVVGLYVERSLEIIVGLLGILKAGGAYLPLDPALPKERLAFMLKDSQAPVLVTQHSLVVNLPPTSQPRRVVHLDTDWPTIALHSLQNPTSAVQVGNLIYVLFTSGSTGKPKGVAVEHRQLLNYLHGIMARLELPAGASFATVSTFAADLGNTAIFPALCGGGCLHIISHDRATDPDALADYFYHHPIDCLKIVPSHLAALLSSARPEQILPRQRLVLGGEACPWDLVKKVQTLAPNCTIFNHYGPTETTVGVLTYRVAGPATGQVNGYQVATVPLGRPLANTQIYLLDADRQPVPIWAAGEVYIGGAGLSRGYLNHPELTAERFIRQKAEGGAPITARGQVMKDESPSSFILHPSSLILYKTGDLARYLPDGNIEFLGRIDHQIKLQGFRIELGEIETALSQHPLVQEAVVIVREDITDQKRLVAYVVSPQEQPGQLEPAVFSKELHNFLKRQLPDFMIPTAFVPLNALPLTPNGKLDRQALPAPDRSRLNLENIFVPPRNQPEHLLAQVWAQLLNLEQVGVHDNFFELGGDSILSIQVIARANQAGLRLTPKQLFQYQTIAELALVADTAPAAQAEQGPVTGPVPLTPIQQWFFEQNLPNPHHWNMPMLLEVQTPLEPTLLKKALQLLLEHHDALRLRFKPTAAGWQQVNIGPGEAVSFTYVDLSALPATEQAPAMQAKVAGLQAGLNLTDGPLLQAALFDFGSQQAKQLLLVVHHLVVDGVSWRILVEELQTVYQQLNRGEPIQLPAKTTSFKQWAEQLTHHAQSAAFELELAYWLSRPWEQVLPLPLDYPAARKANIEESARTVSKSLSVAETRALLQDVPAVYRTQINDVLLTALAQAVAQWTGSPLLLVDLEGHGREEILADVDLSRTIGWFTTHFPALLELDEATQPGQALKAVKEQLRRIPNRGIGYGLLRYLRGDGDITAKLRDLPQPELSFNYLGQFDQILPEPAMFRLVKEPGQSARNLAGRRSHLLQVEGIVTAGRLEIGWTYSQNLHRPDTIERLAGDFMATLRAIIAHCQSGEAGGYTPSDFPLAKIDQPALDHLVEKYHRLEDIYPLSAAQQDMLAYTLRTAKAEVYLVQLSFILRGPLQISAFKHAWQHLIDRQPILRTSFIWQGLVEPLQLVHPQVRLVWEQQDWRQLSASAQQEQFEAFLQADQTAGFDLTEAPLMRLRLCQLAENVYHLTWSNHHLIKDGWSTELLLQEVFTLYHALSQGQLLPSPSIRPYRDYIAWLQQQDLAKAETFWRETLRGFTGPTRLKIDEATGGLSTSAANYAVQQMELPAATTSALQKLAQQQRLTLNTLVQAAWALLLSRYSGQNEVVFGVTVSGRPATLAGVETMVGVLINTLPMRVRMPASEAFLPWLKQLQAQQVELQQYTYSPLTQIHQWSAIPAHLPLFESVIRFQNYPMAAAQEKQTDNLSVQLIQWFDVWPYPLSLVAELNPTLSFWLTYDRSRFDPAAIITLVDQFRNLLESFLALESI